MLSGFTQQRFPTAGVTNAVDKNALSKLSMRAEVLEIAVAQLAERHQETPKLLEDLSREVAELKSNLIENEDAQRLSTMQVYATTTQDKLLYKNVTGDYDEDIRKGRKVKRKRKKNDVAEADLQNAPTLIPGGSVIRLIFPQESMDESDELVMGAITVDKETMQVQTGWFIISEGDEQFVSDFRV